MMMGMTRGCGFGGTIYYDMDYRGRRDKEARILTSRNVPTFYNDKGDLDADPHMLSRSFRAQAMMNLDVKKCVKHIWISYMPEDLLTMVNNELAGYFYFLTMEEATRSLGEDRIKSITDKAMTEDAKRFLEKLGYYKTQVLVVRHSEKNNPHIHVIVNMVDENGVRLDDFQEINRGRAICKEITMNRHYHWGEHESTSKTKSNNETSEVRKEICRSLFQIASDGMPASKLKALALGVGIGIKFKTDFKTGVIKGLSFEKSGKCFKASDVDASLSATKLFPYQVESARPLSALSPLEQGIVKSGGIVKGFNDQIICPPHIPDVPDEIKASQRREEYHKVIRQALRNRDEYSYACNVAALALDPLCGPAKERVRAVSTYVQGEKDEKRDYRQIRTIQESLLKVEKGIESSSAGKSSSPLDLFLLFMEWLMRQLLDLRFIRITSGIRRSRDAWLSGMAHNGVALLFGLAFEIAAAVCELFLGNENDNAAIKEVTHSAQKTTETVTSKTPNDNNALNNDDKKNQSKLRRK